jgi:endonuclease/exonuclease/phosphatase family metal-dependent hydrolase
VKELKLLNISSLYHKISNEKEGEESVPTFYLQRKLNKHYHIDYVFVSDILINKDTSLEILESNNWLEYSDHIPIKVEIDLN